MKKLGTLIFWIVIPIVCFLLVDKGKRGENSVLHNLMNDGDVATAVGTMVPSPATEQLSVIEDSNLDEQLNTERNYAYQHLNEEEQQVYRSIYALLMEHKPDKEIKIMQEDLIDKVWTCVIYDNPEIFYVNGYTRVEYSNTLGKLTGCGFLANYTMSEKEINRHQEELESVTHEIIGGIPQTNDDYEKVKYLYDYIIATTDYDNAAYERHLANENVEMTFDILSVFERHQTVCAGYSKAFQYLCNQINIPCTFINGVANNSIATDGHAWNLVKVNGEWYFVDVTWGDASFMTTNGLDISSDFTNYAYLCTTTEDICKTHKIEMPYDIENCTSMKENYYVRNGLYFMELNEEQLQRAFSSNTNGILVLKCNSLDLCQQLKSYLIDEQHIYNYNKQSKGYVVQEDQNAIMIIL